jgi:ubiquinone/menaquinone biosynthesis C-methylase UbiE
MTENDTSLVQMSTEASAKSSDTATLSADSTVISQKWRDRAFCEQYAETWEISTNEVHYGWLAPGENTLRLLPTARIEGAAILDIGCGMGENLITLAKKGGECFGIDISEFMLAFARERHRKIGLARQDMREFTAFTGVNFDIVLSIYSLEYLSSLKDFRDVLATVFNRMRPGATFVFCFSHPLQHIRHSMLRNESALCDPTEISPLIYSFKDVIASLDETGFTIDRIVEQHTLNPSAITYEQSVLFPYHFHRGKNPCSALLDNQSNAAPHTVIYKVRKPDSGSLVKRQMSLQMQFGKVLIWGEYRRVRDRISFTTNKRKFHILKLEPRDAVVGICSILEFSIGESDIRKGQGIRIAVADGKISILRNSLLGIIFRHRTRDRLNFVFHQDWIAIPEHRKLLNSLYISRIDPVFGLFLNEFPREEIGVLVFVNGEEPGAGKVGLQDFFPAPSDRIEIVYVAFNRERAAANDFLRDDKQLDLFTRKNSKKSRFPRD